MHYDRLISALNKHWRSLKEDEFWDEMDTVDTNNAIHISQFPKEISNWIWESRRNLGDIF